MDMNLECGAGAAVSPNIPAAPVAMEVADGWLVVAWWQDPAIVYPTRGKWSYEWFATEAEATEHFGELERGEFRGFTPFHILPCRQGVPLGAKRMPI